MPRIRADALPEPDERGVIDLRRCAQPKARGNHKCELERVRRAVVRLGGKALVLAQSARLYGSAGLPDMLVILPRSGGWQAVWVEVKARGDSLRPAQIEVIDLLRRCGQHVVVGTVDDLVEWYRARLPTGKRLTARNRSDSVRPDTSGSIP